MEGVRLPGILGGGARVEQELLLRRIHQELQTSTKCQFVTDRFRGGLVSTAHRLLHYTTLGSRETKKKQKDQPRKGSSRHGSWWSAQRLDPRAESQLLGPRDFWRGKGVVDLAGTVDLAAVFLDASLVGGGNADQL